MKKLLALSGIGIVVSSSLNVVACDGSGHDYTYANKTDISVFNNELNESIAEINKDPKFFLPRHTIGNLRNYFNESIKRELDKKDISLGEFETNCTNLNQLDAVYWSISPKFKLTIPDSNNQYKGSFSFTLNHAENNINNIDQDIDIDNKNDQYSIFIKLINDFSEDKSDVNKNNLITMVAFYMSDFNVYIGNVRNLDFVELNLDDNSDMSKYILNITLKDFSKNDDLTLTFNIEKQTHSENKVS